MISFSYYDPHTLKEALVLLEEYQDNGVPLAGGTDLLVQLKKGQIRTEHLIDLKKISSLKKLEKDEKGALHIGAMATMHVLNTSRLLQNGFGILAMASSKLGSPQIRNRATIGGNICNASPSGETLSALLCLEAQLKLESSEKERVVAAQDFFKGPGDTVAADGEILTEIIVPALPAQTVGIYKKLSLRNAVDLAVVSVAVVARLDASQRFFEDIRIGLGAVAPTPIRAKSAEDFLKGTKIDERALGKAAKLACQDSNPISDVRASKWYRQAMVSHLTNEAIYELWRQILS